MKSDSEKEELARQIRTVPDDELGRYRLLDEELWKQEIDYRWPGRTIDAGKKALPPPTPAKSAPPDPSIAKARKELVKLLKKGSHTQEELQRALDLLVEAGEFPGLPLAVEQAISEFVSEKRGKQIAAIEQRLFALESGLEATREAVATKLSYQGVFRSGKTYRQNDVCTHRGSSWICKAETVSRPGEDPASWTLMVKQGRSEE